MSDKKQKRVLGRGLDALLNNSGESPSINDLQRISNSFEISIDKIRVNPKQPRTNFDTNEIENLSQSIKDLGIIQPITVRKVDPENYTAVDHMVDTALWEISILESLNFEQIKISLKAFEVDTTIEAYRRLAKLVPYPFHLGITEAGTAKSGSIRSAIGLGILLYEGIGDTIRVSLSDDSKEEIITGYEILKSLNLRTKGTTLVACPSCGRADINVKKLANMVDDALKHVDKNIKVAVMGCEVNGPGEAKDADIGIAGGVGKAIIFKKGVKSRVVDESEMFEALIEEINNLEVEESSL